jgi:hypothetical protein
MSMSYHAETYEDYDRPWFQKKSLWSIAAVILCLLAAGIGIFTYVGLSKIPDIGGGLTIEADPGTRIYIGDKLVGTTNVTFTWTELFGDDKHQALAFELPDLNAKVTPDLISGAGAKVLDSQGTGRNDSLVIKVAGDKYMMRRADCTLDEVFAYVIDWAPPDQPPRRFLLPIRVRKGKGNSTDYFNPIGSGSSASSGPGFVKAFGRSPIEVQENLRFSAGTPPPQFAEEIKTKGLWEPGGEK